MSNMASTKILDYTQLTTAVGTEALVVADSASTNKYITISDGLKLWFQEVDANGNNLTGINYFNFNKIAKPADPPTEEGRMYLKEIDANNNGLFIIIQKAGALTEVQIG
jgi:hypothetical protein